MGCEDLQTHLSAQTLLINGKLQTLNQITALTNNELSRKDARIVNREDHFHDLEKQNQSQGQGQGFDSAKTASLI